MKVKVTACKCDKCNHIWLGRTKNPVCCPACKSAYWNRGKKVITNSNVKEPIPKVEPKDDLLAPKLYAKEINNRFKEDRKIRSELVKKMKSEPEPEPVAKTKPPKEDDIDTLKRDCLACTEKYKTDGKWHCTSFNYKSRPKYDRCRLCWELIEIWGEQAAGYEERRKQ